jgi:hypothetical protein
VTTVFAQSAGTDVCQCLAGQVVITGRSLLGELPDQSSDSVSCFVTTGREYRRGHSGELAGKSWKVALDHMGHALAKIDELHVWWAPDIALDLERVANQEYVVQ